jgi:protein-S-isoprenylcysteine O-methyltransferase Ste14
MEFHWPYKLLLSTIFGSALLGIYFPLFGFPFYAGLVIGSFLIAASFIFGFYTRRFLRSHDTTTSPEGEPAVLVTTGPFEFTRNPMYLSYVIIAFAAAVCAPSKMGSVLPLIYFLYLNNFIIPEEEKRLAAKFPEGFGEYAKRVRRWI